MQSQQGPQVADVVSILDQLFYDVVNLSIIDGQLRRDHLAVAVVILAQRRRREEHPHEQE